MRLASRSRLGGALLQFHAGGNVPPTVGAQRFISDKKNEDATANAKLIYPDASSREHSDLPTFLAYVKRAKLNRNSTVYKGTHYEYTVAEALSQYGFFLKRVGGASDRGLDLLGTWAVPTTTRAARVIVQCKAGSRSLSPMYVRELKGAMSEAPPGWRGDEVLGLLVGEKPATRGVLEELRTTVGLGYVCCSKEGNVKQFLWNQKAQEMGLEGVTVGIKYMDDGSTKRLVFMKGGKILPLLDKIDGAVG